MQKQAPTFGRILVMVGFALSCFGLLLFLWLAFGGAIPLEPQGWRFKVQFGEATQLTKEADVRISGVPVGKVKTITLARDGRSTAVIELQRRYAPLASDARAILRQKTLLGETFVELTRGSPGARRLPENGTLPIGNVSPAVELDEIFRAFDEPTRRAFQGWMQTLAQGTRGRGQDLNDAFGNLAPLAEDANPLVSILLSQQTAVQRLVRNTGEVATALSERDGQLSSLIVNANRVFQTTAARNSELQQTFLALPTFLRESRLTFDRLTRFAGSTNPLVTQLRPAARELSPTLIDLSALAPDLRAFFRDVNPLITASRRGLPALRRVLDDARPLLAQLDPFLRQVRPLLEEVGLYTNELRAFFANTAAATQATDQPTGAKGPVHYLRLTAPINPENLAVYPTRAPTNRPNPYQFPGAMSRLPTGLPVYENRQCDVRRLLPALSGLPGFIITPQLITLLNQFVFGSGTTSGALPAPPCNQQGPFNSIGAVPSGQPSVTRYPRTWTAGPPPR
jgi:phospholipid/cholesterol/gamma-HCH transport system substrate-binding protein